MTSVWPQHTDILTKHTGAEDGCYGDKIWKQRNEEEFHSTCIMYTDIK